MQMASEAAIKGDIEQLISRRHHTCRHIQKVLTKAGAFWLNSVSINIEDVEKSLCADAKEEEHLQRKLHKLYTLGIAFGKVLDISNVNNLVSFLSYF